MSNRIFAKILCRQNYGDGVTCVTAVAISSDTYPSSQTNRKFGKADGAGTGTIAVVSPTGYLPKYRVGKIMVMVSHE